MYSPVSHTKSLGESREWNMVFQGNIWCRLKAFKKMNEFPHFWPHKVYSTLRSKQKYMIKLTCKLVYHNINTMCHRYWFLTEIRSFMLRSNQKSLPFQKRLKVWKAMSQKLFKVGIPNLDQIVFNYYQMDYKCYFGFIYYNLVTMATNLAQDNPYPHIRFTIMFCLTVKGWSKHLTSHMPLFQAHISEHTTRIKIFQTIRR